MSNVTYERLQAARTALRELHVELKVLGERLAAIDKETAPAAQAVGNVQSLRQERRGIFERLLRLGQPNAHASPELSKLDAKVALATPLFERAQDMLDAAAEMRRELEAQQAELAQKIQAAGKAIQVAALEVARQEVDCQAIPQFIVALVAFKMAFAKVQGTVLACKRLAWQQDPRTTSPFAMTLDPSVLNHVVVSVPELHLEERLRNHPSLRGQNINQAVLDASAQIEQIAREAMERWVTT